MKKAKFLIPLTTVVGISTVLPLAIVGCNKNRERIVEPTEAEKTTTASAGVKEAIYKITLLDDAKFTDFKISANTSSNVVITIEPMSVENKVLSFKTTLSDIGPVGKQTFNFDIVIANTKAGWERTVKGYSFNFTAAPISKIVLDCPTSLEYGWTTPNPITIKSYEPAEAKLVQSLTKFSSISPNILSCSEDGYVKALIGDTTQTGGIKCEVEDSNGYQTSTEAYIAIANTAQPIAIKGSLNVDADTDTHEFKVYDTYNRDQTQYVEWSVIDGTDLVTLDSSVKGKIHITDKAKLSGGLFTLQAKFGSEITTLTCEIASYNKLDETAALAGKVKAKNVEISGNLIIPPCYYDANGTAHVLNKIEKDAFKDCVGLKNLIISKNINDVDPEMFSGCSGLETMSVDSANECLTSEENCLYTKKAIEGKYEAKTIVWGLCDSAVPTDANKVTQIGPKAFLNNEFVSGRTMITIGTNISKIGDSAFENTNILSLTFSANNSTGVEIGSNAFASCTNLMAVDVETDTKLPKIGNGAFSGDTNLTLFNHVSEGTYGEIGDEAFKDSGITKFANGTKNGITSIGAAAFKNCANLTNIYVPITCTKIGAGAFAGCNEEGFYATFEPNPASTEMPRNQWTFSDDSDRTCLWTPNYLDETQKTEGWFLANPNYQKYDKTTIGPQFCFMNGIWIKAVEEFNLTDLAIPDRYAYISTGKYEPGKVTTIAPDAFKDRTCIKTVDLYGTEQNITTVSENAFSGCSNITQIKIGKNVLRDNVGTNAFQFNATSNVLVIVDSRTIANSTDDCEGLFNLDYVKEIYVENSLSPGHDSFIEKNFPYMSSAPGNYNRYFRR